MKWLTKRRLLEKQPLPTGRKEFEEWSNRIISKADLTITKDSAKYTLANVLVNSCGPSVAFESDAYFINYLRKSAVNQVALTIRDEIYAARKAQNNPAQPAPPEAGNAEVVQIK